MSLALGPESVMFGLASRAQKFSKLEVLGLGSEVLKLRYEVLELGYEVFGARVRGCGACTRFWG